jgi:hypothetical protein
MDLPTSGLFVSGCPPLHVVAPDTRLSDRAAQQLAVIYA